MTHASSSILDSLSLLLRVIVTENTPLGRVLVALIVLLALVGIRYALQHTRRYRRTEMTALDQARTHLHNVQETQQSSTEDAATKRLSHLVAPDVLAQAVPASSIIGDRLQMLALLRKSQTKVNLSALQQISRAREAARVSLRFPGMAVNLLMLVGLLGTFIGIAIVIEQIGMNITLGDASLQSFGKAFSGMYTKFSTTLAGLACTIVLGALNFRLAQSQERFFEELDRFTVAELLPATVPTLEDETLLERISLQLEQSFSRIEEIALQNSKTVEDVAAIQAGFADIVDKIREQTRAEGPDRLQNLIGQTAGVMTQVGRLNDNLQALAHATRTTPAATAPAPSWQPPPENKIPNAAGFLAFAVSVVILLITLVVRG